MEYLRHIKLPRRSFVDMEKIFIPCSYNPELKLEVYKGHFASDRFHSNYYIDLIPMKVQLAKAKLTAEAMADKYVHRVKTGARKGIGSEYAALSSDLAMSTPIDTIICMDGCEALGAYVADKLSGYGVSTNNEFGTYNIVTPDFDDSGALLVTDDFQKMLKGKNILILLATAMQGKTLGRILSTVSEYGGHIIGISVIFSMVDSLDGYPVNAVFSREDIPDFELSNDKGCELCGKKVPVDGIITRYGLRKI